MAKETTYEDIAKTIKKKVFSPVYLLMGEEDYYIDQLTDLIEENALTETEKEFNLSVFYGLDTEIETVVNAAKRYPMMSERQVVIVKESQRLTRIEELTYYLQKPLETTILVLCYKHGCIDRRKKIVAEIAKVGTVFESKQLKETHIPGFISSYLKRKKVEIEPKASEILTDFVGTDLSRMVGELEKLIITLAPGQCRITSEQIERNIGISKDYNNFELKNAIIDKDIMKANRIVKYFDSNPKNNPLQPTLGILFAYFSNLMVAYYAPQKTEQAVAAFLGFKSPWQAKDYIKGMYKYSGVKTMHIITAIRECDAKSKGLGNVTISNGELLRELIYFILH